MGILRRPEEDHPALCSSAIFASPGIALSPSAVHRAAGGAPRVERYSESDRRAGSRLGVQRAVGQGSVRPVGRRRSGPDDYLFGHQQ